MPQQLGVGVNFAAELLVMGLGMIINMNKDFILISMDIVNAFCEVMRASVIERHMEHDKFRGMVPYRRAKLGPTTNLWAWDGSMEYSEGLVEGSPTSSSGFSYTIHEIVKKANRRLVECGGCSRFGMHTGYMIGPKEVVFEVLTKFVEALREEHGCRLNTRKCKMYIINERMFQQAKEEGWIPTESVHLEEGTLVDETGNNLRGIQIFNVPVWEENYVATMLKEKAKRVENTTRRYVEDLEDQYPQELWTMLQFSLQHRVTYWLRTCTPEETEEMVAHVDCCIMEAVHAATGVDFDMEETTRK